MVESIITCEDGSQVSRSKTWCERSETSVISETK